METNYLKEQFRKDILKEVEEYIGYVYSDDTHFEDKLIVKEFDYSVSYGNMCYRPHRLAQTRFCKSPANHISRQPPAMPGKTCL